MTCAASQILSQLQAEEEEKAPRTIKGVPRCDRCKNFTRNSNLHFNDPSQGQGKLENIIPGAKMLK